jgi:hypothetical protein
MSMLNDLKAAIKKHGSIARTNRFKVDFTGMRPYAKNDDQIRDLEYFLEDVNIPSKDIETVDYSPYRNPIAYATGYKHGDFNMKFRAPTNMFVKRIFDRWIEKIVPREDYKLSYRKENVVNFRITQESERTPDHDKYLGINYYNVLILDAYPISISSIEYSNTQESEYVSFDVGFAFRDVQYFTPKGTVIVGSEQLDEPLDLGDGTVPVPTPIASIPYGFVPAQSPIENATSISDFIRKQSKVPVQEPTPLARPVDVNKLLTPIRDNNTNY